MELRVLQYFLAVAREQNISAAARSLHLTQPTLSRQLKELEEELGKQLMIRGNRKITLTEDGMLLRKRAEEILDLVGRTEKEIAQSDETISGDIYIGTGETDGVRQIARTAHQLQERYPGILFHIVSGDAVDVCERLDKGLLDFGVLIQPADLSKYDYVNLPEKDVWGVVTRKDSPLAARQAITRQDFQDRYMEIRSGLEETSRILKLTSDHVIERDAEYQKTLAQAQAKGQVSQRQQAPRKEKKAWNNSRRELESTRQDVDMRLATYEQTVNNLML